MPKPHGVVRFFGVAAAAGALCAAGLLLRWSACPGRGALVTLPDSVRWTDSARAGVLPCLLFRFNPRGYPLVIRALGNDPSRVVRFQRVLAGLAWLAVSLAVARRLRTPLVSWCAAVSIFALGCSPFVACWDSAIMTESVSHSLFVIFIALIVCWDSLARPLGGLCALVCVASFLSIVRPTNFYILPALFAYCAALEVHAVATGDAGREWGRCGWRVAARLLLVALIPAEFLFFQYEMRSSGRWVTPLENSLNMRVLVGKVAAAPRPETRAEDGAGARSRRTRRGSILPNKEHFDFFVRRHGMPPSGALSRIGRWEWDVTGSPAPEYDRWVATRGYDAYGDFLLHHPRWVLEQCGPACEPYADTRSGLPPAGRGARAPGRAARACAVIPGLLTYPAGACARVAYSFFGMGAVCAAAAWWWVRLMRSPARSESPALVAAIAILFYVAPAIALVSRLGDGDPHSDWRHALAGMIAYHLGFLMLAWTAADRLAQRWFPADRGEGRGTHL